MRVFKSSYKDRTTGKSRQTARWYVELRDHRNIIRRLPAFTDKNQSLALGRTVLKLVENRQSGEPLTVELSRWLETVSDATKATLARWGLIDQSRLTGSKPLTGHISDWKADMLAQGNTAKHANLSASRVERLTADCGFNFYSDISAAKIQQKLADYRKNTLDARGHAETGIGLKTTNYYLRDLKSFCRWMMHERRVNANPVEYLDALNAKVDVRRQRRTLSEVDMRKLLTATRNGPERRGMSGQERALVYELSATTGLRVSELASLTVASFTLDESPSVTIDAAYAKNRRRDTLPLRADMAEHLRNFLATKLPGTKVFPKLSNHNSAQMIKADLEAAGLPFELDGKYFDFHSLRHQFISGLAAVGIHPKTAQQLARHSTITLTMDNYTHVFRGELDKAVNALPDWHTPTPELARATGTVNQSAAVGLRPLAPVVAKASSRSKEKSSAFCLALSNEKEQSLTDSDELKSDEVPSEEKHCEHEKIRMDIGDSDKGRSGIRTHDKRICNPPP